MNNPESGNPPGRLRRALPAAIAIVISLGLLAWALRGVSLATVLEHIAAAKPGPLLASIIIATLTFPLRLLRWRLLLRDEGGQPYRAAPLWHAIAIGFMANNVLPLRAGELVRSYTVARLTPARFTSAFTSVAVERIFDALTVVALLALALLTSDLPSSVRIGGTSLVGLARVAGLVGVLALLAAIVVVAAPLAAEAVIRRLFHHTKFADRVVDLIEGVRHGLAVLRSPGRLVGVIVWSLVLWLANAFAFFVGFAAFDIPVSYMGALLMQGLLVLGVSVPSTPGFFGPFEAVIVAALALYGVPGSLAFSYAITFHITTFIPITLLGLWSLTRSPEGLGSLRRASR